MSDTEETEQADNDENTLTDEELGTFTYYEAANGSGEWIAYEEVPWCGDVVSGEVTFACTDEEGQLKDCLERLRELSRKSETIDAAAKEFACKEKLQLANEWKAADDPPITKGVFVGKLDISGITVFPTGQGGIGLQYECDEMFTDHAINDFQDDDGEFTNCRL